MRKFFISIVYITLFSFYLHAQTNLSNINVYETEDYKIAERYRQFAIEAQEIGDYDKSIEFSKAGQEYAQSVLAYSTFLTLAYRVENSRIKSIENITMFKGMGGDSNSLSSDLYAISLSNQNEGLSYIKMAGDNTNNIEIYSNSFISAIDSFDKSSYISEIGYNIVMAGNKRISLIANSIIVEKDSNDTLVLNLIDEAKIAINVEDYETSMNKAKEVLNLLNDFEGYFNASNIYSLAKKALDGAKNAGKDKSYSNEYSGALVLLQSSKSYLDNKAYSSSIKDSQSVLTIVDKMGGLTTVLPMYYKVVSRPKNTDSLWLISSYDFIYGDGMYWYILYNANKQKLKNPKNPNLILPGQILVIPSLKGELRDGMYDPNKEYGSIKDLSEK